MKKVLKLIFKITIFFVGWAILVSLIPIPEFENNLLFMSFAELIPFVSIVLFNLIFCRIENDIKLNVFNISLKKLLISIAIGLVWIFSVILIVYLLDGIKFSGINRVYNLGIWSILLLVNTIMQELLVRGYIYQLIKGSYSVPVATIITTAIFTLMHGGILEAGVIPIMNVLTMSLFMTIVMEYYHSIIVPIIIHYVWNLLGGIIISGISVSELYPTVLNLDFVGNSIISGGQYKLEGSAIVLFINIVFILIFYIKNLKKKGL